ncbi:uncharacterized protein N7515_008856 [Penicillium bovifimosum]|uniref:Uncharacterized protein n=1 Tax=Penicillium bovifimosum TaxID=126998 RepID=A0A9W9GNR9_9EURO|nr:uncharacterized protein N7515_008856 [Penicillium bovifimosum]KAJ5125031.1 hypothetical protein N7515_008856 [Penicillium bovifimosum]
MTMVADIVSLAAQVARNLYRSGQLPHWLPFSSSLTEADNPRLSPALLRSMSSFGVMDPQFFAMPTADWDRQITERAKENAQEAANFERTDQTQDRESSN